MASSAQHLQWASEVHERHLVVKGEESLDGLGLTTLFSDRTHLAGCGCVILKLLLDVFVVVDKLNGCIEKASCSKSGVVGKVRDKAREHAGRRFSVFVWEGNAPSALCFDTLFTSPCD
jgi:hypothetical protein